MNPIEHSSAVDSMFIHAITPGITVEYLADDHIVAYTIKTTNRAEIEAYGDAVIEILNRWPAELPYLQIQDFADSSISFSPIVRAQIERIATARPDIKRRFTALVVPKNYMVQMVEYILRARRSTADREGRMFYTREEALGWLISKL